MSKDNFLDDDTILVPQTLPLPHSYSTQLVKRLHVKSFWNRRVDAINSNTNTTVGDAVNSNSTTNTTITGEHNNGVCGKPIILHLFTYVPFLSIVT